MIDVVVVDDDVNVRRGLQKLVNWEELGARLVLVGKSGQEVIEYLDKHRVDFVISDVKMPSMDGLELSKRIKKYSPDTVVVLLSAYNEFDLVQEALQYGVYKYILKPINKEKLKMLSDMVREVSEDRQQKKRLTELIYNSDFRYVVKKAFQENDIGVLESVLTLDKHFSKAKLGLMREYYKFLFNILTEFAREVDKEHFFEESLFDEFSRCVNEDEYKKFIFNLYGRIMKSGNISDSRKEKVGSNDIKEYIDSHYAEYGFSTSDIVKRFKFSVSHLSAIFKKTEGVTIVDYITNKKIERAAQLIRESDFSIKYISSLVGYDNIQYFSKVFKRIMKISPTDYSNKYRGGGKGL